MENQPSNTQVDKHTLDLDVKIKVDQLSQEELVKAMILAIGDDPSREGVLDTPKRVVKSWKEIFGGYSENYRSVLGTTFDAAGYDQMVICQDIEMYSTCEHHMIPFFGKVHIGYIPGPRVVGLSKLARLVEVFSRRLQIQEKLTEQIASAIDEVLAPKGVMVVIKAKHLCMCGRGVQKQHSQMVTSSIRGAFKGDAARAEFMGLIK